MQRRLECSQAPRQHQWNVPNELLKIPGCVHCRSESRCKQHHVDAAEGIPGGYTVLDGSFSSSGQLVSNVSPHQGHLSLALGSCCSLSSEELMWLPVHAQPEVGYYLSPGPASALLHRGEFVTFSPMQTTGAVYKQILVTN